MLTFAHWILVVAYIAVLPAAAGWVAWRVYRSKKVGPAGSFIVTCMVGIVLGCSMSVIYAVAVQGRVAFAQMALASYFAASMLLLIKIFDRLLRKSLVKLFRVGSESAGGNGKFLRAQLAGSIRVVLMFVLALPYVMAAVMTYRPKVALTDDPKSQLGFEYQPVEFDATDGTHLRGWWIPAMQPLGFTRTNEDWGRRTVIICHGLGANRANQLILSRALVPNGYNVLAFDFRAHGESGGQLTTFGDLERFDVLGAVRWIRQNRAEESQKIFGVGASMGAAALVAAAADDSAEGQAIDALALYACYDSISGLAREMSKERFLFPLDWLTTHVSLPLASLQVGTNLEEFSPAELASNIWPRPILFIHGHHDEVIPFASGAALYQAADVPKWHVWAPRGDHNNIVNSEFLAEIVRGFFNKAEPLPII
jgi:fermentation-respiration switch protein FrsA (DUF1100 family)